MAARPRSVSTDPPDGTLRRCPLRPAKTRTTRTTRIAVSAAATRTTAAHAHGVRWATSGIDREALQGHGRCAVRGQRHHASGQTARGPGVERSVTRDHLGAKTDDDDVADKRGAHKIARLVCAGLPRCLYVLESLPRPTRLTRRAKSRRSRETEVSSCLAPSARDQPRIPG